MAYEVTYGIRPLWVGRTGNTQYFLHRATIRARGESWELPGYALWASHGRWSELVEAYVDAQIEPVAGLYGDQIALAEATSQQLPEPNRRDVQEFVVKFRELCERENDPLLESETLL